MMNLLGTLNIKEGEGRPILLLVVYSFFMGLSIAFFFTATISDFLTHFEIEVLPYTYILSGILGYVLWLIWSKLEKRIGFPVRLILGISFLFITVSALCIFLLMATSPWISFAMLVWVRVFIFVNMVNFWGMAGRLFNLSQGKRLFGIITTGSVISDIVGFFSIPLILLLGVSNTGLVVISLVALLFCWIITLVISKNFRASLRENFASRRKMLDRGSKQPFFKSRYHLYLFSLAILPMFGFYFVDYLFLDQIQMQYQDSPTALAGFMGIFFGVVAIFELIIKTSVFSKLIYNFGLKVALLALPVVLLVTVMLTIFLGVVAGSFGFLFSMIAFIKLLEKVLRSGVNDPAFQILYQPIPSSERLVFQSKMEGVPTALGNTVAGVLILILIPLGLTGPLIYNIIFLMVLILWTYMAFRMQDEYRNRIMSDTEVDVDSEEDMETRSMNTDDLLTDLQLYADGKGTSNSASDKLERIIALSQSGSSMEKREAIESLLYDDDERVINELIKLIPQPLDTGMGHSIIDNIENVPHFHLITPLLRSRNRSIEHFLIKKMQQMEAGQISDLDQRILFIHLMDILDDQNGGDSREYFIKLLNHGNKEVRNRALIALEHMASDNWTEHHSVFEQNVETEVAFYAWLVACKRDLELDRIRMEDILEILETELKQTRDRVFSFLTFLYPKDIVNKIRGNINSGRTDKEILAAEMCDLLFDETMKPLLMPIMSEVGPDEKLKSLNKEFPQQTLLPIERLLDISYGDFNRVNTWLRILSMYKLSENVDKIPREILANLHIEDPFIKETAYCCAFGIDGTLARKKLLMESKDFQNKVENLLGTDPKLGKAASIYEKVDRLKQCPLFTDLDEDILLKLALKLFRVDLVGGQMYSRYYLPTDHVHFIVNGLVAIRSKRGDKLEFEPNDLMGLFHPIDLTKGGVLSHTEAEILAIDKRRFCQLVLVYDGLSQALASRYYETDEIESTPGG